MRADYFWSWNGSRADGLVVSLAAPVRDTRGRPLPVPRLVLLVGGNALGTGLGADASRAVGASVPTPASGAEMDGLTGTGGADVVVAVVAARGSGFPRAYTSSAPAAASSRAPAASARRPFAPCSTECPEIVDGGRPESAAGPGGEFDWRSAGVSPNPDGSPSARASSSICSVAEGKRRSGSR